MGLGLGRHVTTVLSILTLEALLKVFRILLKYNWKEKAGMGSVV